MKLQLIGYSALLMTASALAKAPGEAPASVPQATSCDGPEYRQFDFWLGDWNVYQATGDKLVAHSRIEKLYGGCAVRENWMPIGRTGGGSLNIYLPSKKSWRQFWVDSSNNLNEYSGGLVGQAMKLTGTSLTAAGTKLKVRMTYTHASDGSVTQRCERSDDSGKTWAVDCLFIYKPVQSPPS